MEDKMPYRDEIFSKAVRAGKRTYFFDVKTTKGNDLYLTITESKKKTNHDGKSHYEKHKIFLYKEDFEKFSLGFDEAIDKIQELKDAETAAANEKTSGKQKLKDLGLDDDEIKALMGA